MPGLRRAPAARAGKYRLNDATGMLARIGDFGAPPAAGAAAAAELRPRTLRSVR
ncbi:hypothetical protein HK414_09135 [Ramlibacter terrae]|uniref:Uncharacterized protein n=1 Tax=Ramlibacter terrae TaxID=2732511 RepID=A0ABX6P1P4_9BURK|nr:hypothetical protein HK414_09135 [Ramlibacter terrae]